MPLLGPIGTLCAVLGYRVFTHFTLAHQHTRLVLAALVRDCGVIVLPFTGATALRFTVTRCEERIAAGRAEYARGALSSDSEDNKHIFSSLRSLSGYIATQRIR